MNNVDILIISNKLDFTTDYVCLELSRRKLQYLRLNRDDFDKYRITLTLLSREMLIGIDNEIYSINNNSLKSIYYRAPIYLRDIYKPNIPPEGQLFRTQWTAFIRNLTIFNNITWINNPTSTFNAENKMLQLLYANEIGFLCPETTITNDNDINSNDNKIFIVKSIDSAVLNIGNQEAFVYSNKISGSEIKKSNLSISPIILQDYIYPKIDIRVTVIDKKVYAVRILKNNQGIDGDWRKEKNDVQFIRFELPENIIDYCIEIVKMLDLKFGAIDLIESDDDFYFLEINPTGEWAWLVETAGLNIFEDICNCLENGENQ
ncbi:MAG: hypothetical protein GY754_05145 [bacterium]|nr:hypothetical protein [bacterium]